MLVVLLLISQISCDWVEISQNNYRKEPPLRAVQQAVNVRYEDKPQDSRLDRKNHSLIQNPWNKAIIDRVTNVGNIKRVQDPSVKTPSIKMRPTENVLHKTSSDKIDLINRHNINSELPRVSIYSPLQVEETKRIEATHRDLITKSSNKELVKHSHVIDNSNVKNLVKSSKVPSNHRKIVIENLNNSPIKESGVNKIYRDQESEEEFDEDDTAIEDSNLHVGNVKIIRNFQRIPHNGHNKFNFVNNLRETHIFSNTSIPKVTRTGDIFRTDNTKHFHTIENFDEDEFKGVSLNDYKFSNDSITTTPNFYNTRLNKIHFKNTDDQITKVDSTSSPKLKIIDLKNNAPEKSMANEEENIIDNDHIVPKAETLRGMWKLMKVVTETIYKNTQRTFKSKIKYLEGLKTTILTSIEEQVENIWPDDIEHRGSRKRRARSDGARGHVEFPSSESTLMTISFLTFAVFLIKLVLQVIHTYKNKTMMVAPAVFAAVGRAAAAIRKQN
ncbi:uncharacterized protein LOC124538409 [Vanessa cardui]|uniref:uncharacterized protein LOC124538409 n=1 Tax=Vanessa cardui TaxID=171605 RepID=UPI001F136D34|nr:uncharacterized protein LOC124538409 [Vanessa cardui]